MTIDPKSLRGADGLYPDDIAETLANANPEKKGFLTRVGTMTLSHRRYDAAYAWLTGMFEEHGTGNEATAGLLYGISGTGKSTVLRRFTKKFGGPFQTASGIVRPVVRVVTPPNSQLGDFHDAILTALGAGDLSMGRPADKKRAVIAQLATQKVKLLILDEFTHVVEDRTERFTKKLMREIKEIVSENICQVVLAGTEKLVAVHAQYDQMRRRSAGDMMITPFDWGNEDDRKEWIAIVGEFGEALDLKPADSFRDERMAERLHKTSSGILDHLAKFLFRATSIAYDEDHEVITEYDLWEAFERMRRGNFTAKNPWKQPPWKSAKPRLLPDEDAEESNLWSRKKPAKKNEVH